MSEDMFDFTEASEAKRSRLTDNLSSEDQAISDCLTNPVILRKIMEQFWSFELLDLSLVNKLWNYEARSLTRRRGSMVARFSSRHDLTGGPQPCQQLLSFISALPSMNVVPLSGLRIYLNGPAHRDVFPTRALLDLSDKVLDRLSLTKFRVQLWGKSPFDKFSPFFLLTQKVLQNVGGRVLDKLQLSTSHAKLMGQIVQGCSSFPNLKILKLKDDDEEHDFDDNVNETLTNLVKSLVARSPALQELHTDEPLNLDSFEGTSVRIVYKYTVHTPFDEIPEDFSVELGLERIQWEYYGPELDMERFNRIAPKLLRNCCTKALRHMQIDAVLAVSFMCFGVQLENVYDFELTIDFIQLERVEPRILRLVKDFDFTHLVPNVTKVNIDSGYGHQDEFFLLPEHMNAIVERAGAVLGKPTPDRAVNIKQLKLFPSLTNDNALFFAQMFPDIERLEIQAGKEPCFENIWKYWTGLREINVRLDAEDFDSLNLDSVFCGIFPDEVAELREENEEFLKRVNIVPVMPAITCLQGLRSLTLCYSARNLDHNHPVHDYLFYDDLNEHDTLIFSKVTGLVAFSKCPHLRVTLQTGSYELWRILQERNHWKPYASVVYLMWS